LLQYSPATPINQQLSELFDEAENYGRFQPMVAFLHQPRTDEELYQILAWLKEYRQHKTYVARQLFRSLLDRVKHAPPAFYFQMDRVLDANRRDWFEEEEQEQPKYRQPRIPTSMPVIP